MDRPPEKTGGLRERRLRAGLTQQRLADLSGLARQHVSALENHRLSLTDERARKLAPHLGAHPAELVVGHAASLVLRDANKTSVTVADFHALVRAFAAARSVRIRSTSPRVKLELVTAVKVMSDRLFGVWGRLVERALRDAERSSEAWTEES